MFLFRIPVRAMEFLLDHAEAVEKIHVARLVKICFNNQNFRENYKN